MALSLQLSLRRSAERRASHGNHEYLCDVGRIGIRERLEVSLAEVLLLLLLLLLPDP
jgi:hypothetical protein